jgi:hypothetical protein
MAKLYWRFKKNGKWTWKAATKNNATNGYFVPHIKMTQEEE